MAVLKDSAVRYSIFVFHEVNTHARKHEHVKTYLPIQFFKHFLCWNKVFH